MKVVAMLAWFEEDPQMLRDCIRSLAGFADHVVCVDGPYAQFPHTKVRSAQKQYDAIFDAAASIRLPVNIHYLERAHESECTKRTDMFALAETVAEPGVDWLFTIDADEVIVQTRDVKYDLADTDLDVGTVTLNDPAGTFAVPQLFRAGQGVTVGPAHYQYTARDGRRLWCCHNATVEQYPSHRKLFLEHRQRGSDQRELLRWTYYLNRDNQRVEVPEIDQIPHPAPGVIGADALAAGPPVAPGLSLARH